jgi:hypothetical protein
VLLEKIELGELLANLLRTDESTMFDLEGNNGFTHQATPKPLKSSEVPLKPSHIHNPRATCSSNNYKLYR